jgi:hypothetical protein
MPLVQLHQFERALPAISCGVSHAMNATPTAMRHDHLLVAGARSMSPMRYTPLVPSQQYPLWKYYPSSATPPPWVAQFVVAVAAARPLIDTANVAGLTSNKVLAALKPGLEGLQYQEDPATKMKLYRPVLFGDNGSAQVAYNVDAVHDALGVVVEMKQDVALAATRFIVISSAPRSS